MADKTEETYDPTTAEVDRAREQGLGVGERDLQRQRAPGVSAAEEQRTGMDADDEEDTGDGFGRAEPVS